MGFATLLLVLVLDPRAEHELFEQFMARARHTGAITVLVSRRFSTVHMTDHIAVIDNGRLIEHGLHTALLTDGDTYTELYRSQAYG